MIRNNSNFKLRTRLLLCLLLFLCTAASAQTAEKLESFAVNVAQFNRHNPQEKVYLHMDNRSYFVGDTLFFKAYVMNATTLQRTRISEVLYVELLNEKGIEMEHKKLKIVGGICHGSFVLKDDYRSGYYEIRAYTRHMLNFGNEKMPWMNIQRFIPEVKLNPFASTPEIKARIAAAGGDPMPPTHPTPIWDQSIVADANHCQFSRVFPVYMRPEKEGVYKREMEWRPMHNELAVPAEVKEELRDDSLRIDFYPEGGAMVAGAPSRIAIDVSDQWGREKFISGYITKGRTSKDSIATFSVQQRGRGVFEFCPQGGANYFAHVTYKGQTYCYALPEVEKSGYTLCVEAPIAQGAATFTVNASKTAEELIGWTLQCRGALTAFDTLRMISGAMQKVSIPAVKLVPGVNQLTLFNARGEVLAERLFFASPRREKPYIQIANKIPHKLKPFEKVTLDLHSVNADNYFVQSHFSLSITDAAENGSTFDTGDIRSEMLLSSDLKGFIKDVDSYFQHSNDTVMRDDLDLLMMVQGWRRYEWQTMAGITPYTPTYTPEYGLQLDGYVITDEAPDDKFADASQYKRLGDLAMRIDMKDAYITVADTFNIDSLGKYHIEFGKDFFGEIPMSMTLLESDGKVHRSGIYSRLKFSYPIIHRAFSPASMPYNYYQNHTPEDDELRSNFTNADWQGDLVIDEVKIKKKRKSKRGINYESPDIVVDYYKEWNNIIDRGIPNANICAPKLYYINDEENDEIKIDPDNESNEITINYTLGRSRLWGRIARAEDSTFNYTSTKKEGYRAYLMPKTINVYSNLVSREPYATIINPDTEDNAYAVWKPIYQKRSLSPRTAPYMLKDGVRHTYYEGYSRVVSFYHRDYENDELPKHDYRRTLYWNPDLTTSVTGKAQVTFFNNSRAKSIHIRAEGFTRNGEFIVYDSERK